jgi:hypothetical protein
MEASEMLDVVHYFLEEDLYVHDKGETASKSATRVKMYREFYGREYKYAYKGYDEPTADQNISASGSATQIDDYEDDLDAESQLRSIKAFNPKNNPAKPYVPPTEFDDTSITPFGNLLDSPLR